MMMLTKTKTFLLFIFVSILFSCSDSSDMVKIVDLKCEYLMNPIGIDVVNPRLTWKIESNENNLKQTGYRILVASSIDKLDKNIGDVWDSDIVQKDKSTHIIYNGSELKTSQKVYWKVQVITNTKENNFWSKPARWEMGLLNKSDWKAKWIGMEDSRKPVPGQKNPAKYFRKSFKVKSDIEDARVYISGLGYYELYINGKKVGDHLLAPSQTNYDKRQVVNYENGKIDNMSKRVLYETHDITEYLQDGKNVISVVLGNGWYYQTERSEYIPLFFDTPRFISQMELKYSDGSKEIVISDDTWKNWNGPIIDNNVYFGEIYDARLENSDWNKNNFDDSFLAKAKIVRAPEGKLKAQMAPPDRIVGTIKPVSITETNNGVYRYDFGKMFSGWVKIKIKGKNGEAVKLTFLEDSNNNYGQTDTYILKGGELEEWEPKFTWHAFRYVHVSGLSTPLTLENLEGKIINSDVKTDGNFKSSNKLFNTIATHFRETQLGNMHGGVPTDCPHRERRGYTGDGQIAAQAAIYSLDMRSFYTKWINDIADAQNKETGYVPNTTPYHSGGGGTAWGSAYIIIPWYMYLYYNDVNILEEHYEGMKKYIEYLDGRKDKDGLIFIDTRNVWDLGDWVPPAHTIISPSYVSSAYYSYDLELMSKISKALEKKSDTKYFKKKSIKTKEAFHKRYFDKTKNSYSIGKQGANVFALAFGLVPEQFEEKVFETLVDNVVEQNKGHFDTGMMATPYLLEVFTKYNRPDLAYTVMNQKDFPSFGYNLERGATTLWETWTGNESHSHPMFGSVAAWFYQGLGGINPDEDNPGFKHIIIKPNIVNDLDFTDVSYKSNYGEIKSSWKYNKGNLELSVVVPPNTTASVFLLGNKIEDTSVDNKNAKFIEAENNYLRFEVVSGKYKFISKNISGLVKSPMLSIPIITPLDTVLFSKDKISISIKDYSKDAVIRYTLDGSAPNENSNIYTKPFDYKVEKSTTIKARVFKDGVEPSSINSSRIVYTDSLVNGIEYKYYFGRWNLLPDFSKLTPNRTGKLYNVTLDGIRDLKDEFALLFSGEIKITENGKYKFYLFSNDGSKLFIDDKLIISNDGPHGFKGVTGEINLSSGKHKIVVEYFQAGGGKGLELLYEGPNVEKQAVPADALFLNIY